MSVTIRFDPPANFNLYQYELGQSVTSDSDLTIVASGTTIGTFPDWISEIGWSGDTGYYYAVRFMTDDGYWTTWSSPRSHGLYGAAGFEYFIHYPSGDTVYLVPQPASGTGEIANWLSYNTEYTVTVISSGLYGSGMAYMEEDYVFAFTSQYCPIFSTVDSVRMAVGPIIEGIPDDTINRMIHRATWDLISRFYNEINPYGCTYDTVPEPVYRWVTCAAGMQALNAAIAAGNIVGNTRKHLGSLDIAYDGASDTLSPGDIRKNLQQCMDDSGLIIGYGVGTRVVSAVKSLHNAYIRHPLADAAWGRMPRRVENNGTTGPWTGATRDYTSYDEGTITELTQEATSSGTSFL